MSTFVTAAAQVNEAETDRSAAMHASDGLPASRDEETEERVIDEDDGGRKREGRDGGEGGRDDERDDDGDDEDGDDEDGDDGDGDEDGEEDGEPAQKPASDKQRERDLLEMVHFNHLHRVSTELHWATDGNDFIDHETPIYQRGGSVQRISVGDNQRIDVMICDSDFCTTCGGDEDVATESATHGLPSVHSVDLQKEGKNAPFKFAPAPRALLDSIKKYSSATGRQCSGYGGSWAGVEEWRNVRFELSNGEDGIWDNRGY
ncbi:hypothetical protein LTR85_008387 [Meristemomyces frigidus]|nr:hypothetical protein LTR85_008387 [Meristemomyces frigidus]